MNNYNKKTSFIKRLLPTKNKKFAFFFVWLLSYVFVILIPFMAFSAGIYTYDKNYRNQIEQFHKSMTTATASGIKEILVDVNELQSMILSNNSYLPDVLSISDSNKYFDSYYVSKFVYDLSLYKTYKSNIDFMYIYIKDTDTIISATGIYDSKYFYEIHFKDYTDYDTWKDQLENKNASNYYPVTANINGLTKNLICFASNTSLIHKSNNSTTSKLFICVDENLFFRSIDIGINYFDTYIFNSNGDTALYSLQTNSPNEIKNLKQLLETKNSNSIELKKINLLATEMTVAIVIPNSYLRKGLTYSHILITILLLFSLIFVFALIIYFMRKNYSPIERIMYALNIQKSDSKTEFSDLNSHIHQLFEKNNALNKELISQNSLLKDFVLIQLISGNYTPDNKHLNIESLSNQFPYDKYVILYFSWTDLPNMFDTDEISNEEKLQDLLFIIQNIFEELFNKNLLASKVVKYDTKAVCIINTNMDEEELFNIIPEKAEYGIKFIESNFNIKLLYAVSKIHNSIFDLSIAYNEAKQSINYKMSLEHRLSSPISQASSTMLYEYPIDMEERLITSILNADSDLSKTILEDIFNKLHNNNRSSEYIDFVTTAIISTFIRIADTKGKYIDFSNFTFQNSSFEECKFELCSYAQTLCDDLKEDKETDDSLPNKILNYVLEHYSDKDLGINTIAIQLGVSSFYLSKKFKEAYNYSLVDFIHKYRLEKAKELIDENKYSFATISEMLGYNHIRTFNRVFKKYVGVTPSEYKKTL